MNSYRHYDPATNPDDECYRPSAKASAGGLAHRRLPNPRLAAERGQILGDVRLTRALQAVESAQRELGDASEGLRAVLTIPELARAFDRFKAEGGVTALDWQDWLQGKCLHGRCQQQLTKHHLRLVANNSCAPTVVTRHGADHAA